MPVLETDFLKALIDPKDELHFNANRALEKLSREKDWKLASTAILELDLILKSRDFSKAERRDIFDALSAKIPENSILKLNLRVAKKACELQDKYAFANFYFDSLHLAIALAHDSIIISSDESFDKVKEAKRIPLEKI